jgi:hypothetical protein
MVDRDEIPGKKIRIRSRPTENVEQINIDISDGREITFEREKKRKNKRIWIQWKIN